METKGGLLLVFVVLALSAATTNATIVTIGLEGEVTYVDEYSSILQELFHVGDPVTGTYVYDSATPDSSPSPTIGQYQHTSEPYGIDLNVGDFIIRTDPKRVDFLIGILNDHNGEDAYGFISYNNLPLSNGIPVDYVSWGLSDYSGSPLSSDQLPARPPILDDWESEEALMILLGYKGAMTLGAKITSLQYIPEPATIVLLLPGILAALKLRTCRLYQKGL